MWVSLFLLFLVKPEPHTIYLFARLYFCSIIITNAVFKFLTPFERFNFGEVGVTLVYLV